MLQTAEALLRGCCIRALPARLDSGCHRAACARLGKAARVWVLQHPAHRSPSVGGHARPCFSDARTAGPRNGVLAEVDPGLKTQEATGWVGDRGQQHKDDRKRPLLPLQLGLPVKRELASSSSVLVIARAGRGWSRGAVLM